MQSRRPSGQPSDRLALLLQERGGASVDLRGGRTGPGRADADARDDHPDDAWDLLAGDLFDGGLPDGDLLDGDEPLRAGRHRRPGVPFLSVPASLRSVELVVGSRAVRGLLVLAVVTALVLGARWLWSQRPAGAAGAQVVTSEEALPGLASGAPPTAGGDEQQDSAEQDGAEQDAADQGAPATQSAAPDVVVHVTGQVREPGVVELPAGSRVVDAVDAAGGLTDEADRSSINLARALVDGEQVWVGRPGEEPPAGWSPPSSAGGTGTAGGTGAAADATSPPPVDLNTATQADLEELPGIGPVTAGHILAWRDEHGRFSRVDELLEVSGIGERTLAQLEPLVTVDG